MAAATERGARRCWRLRSRLAALAERVEPRAARRIGDVVLDVKTSPFASAA